MTKARRMLAALAVAAMASGLVACGDDDDESETTSTSSTTSTAPGSPTSTTAGSTSTTAAGSGVTLDCGTVGFTPASEDAASQIKATGVTCAEARTFVEAAGARTSSGGPQQVTVNGYRCVLTRTVEDPLPFADYECTNGNKKITFTRS